MTIDIPGEYENVIESAVSAGIFASPEAVLRHALDLFVDEQRETVGVQQSPVDHQAWLKNLLSFASLPRPTGFPLDDSRDSMYPDRV